MKLDSFNFSEVDNVIVVVVSDSLPKLYCYSYNN